MEMHHDDVHAVGCRAVHGAVRFNASYHADGGQWSPRGASLRPLCTNHWFAIVIAIIVIGVVHLLAAARRR